MDHSLGPFQPFPYFSLGTRVSTNHHWVTPKASGQGPRTQMFTFNPGLSDGEVPQNEVMLDGVSVMK